MYGGVLGSHGITYRAGWWVSVTELQKWKDQIHREAQTKNDVQARRSVNV